MKHRHYSKSEANLCARVHEKDIMSVGNHLISEMSIIHHILQSHACAKCLVKCGGL